MEFTSRWARKEKLDKIRWHPRRSDACYKKNEMQGTNI